MSFAELRDRLRSFAIQQFGRGVPADEVAVLERQLGNPLPESYASFLREFGWGGVEHLEIYGAGRDVPPYLDLAKVTHSERTEMLPRLPVYLVPVMNDGGGNHYCLDTRSFDGKECPVVFWDHALGESQDPPIVGVTFSSWLKAELDQLTA
jgi:hypothetical protein